MLSHLRDSLLVHVAEWNTRATQNRMVYTVWVQVPSWTLTCNIAGIILSGGGYVLKIKKKAVRFFI